MDWGFPVAARVSFQLSDLSGQLATHPLPSRHGWGRRSTPAVLPTTPPPSSHLRHTSIALLGFRPHSGGGERLELSSSWSVVLAYPLLAVAGGDASGLVNSTILIVG